MAIMDRSFYRIEANIDLPTAKRILNLQPNWLVVEGEEGRIAALLNPSDLAAFLEGRDEAEDDLRIDLLRIPGTAHGRIHHQQ